MPLIQGEHLEEQGSKGWEGKAQEIAGWAVERDDTHERSIEPGGASHMVLTSHATGEETPSVASGSQGRLHRGGGSLAGRCMVCKTIIGQRGCGGGIYSGISQGAF